MRNPVALVELLWRPARARAQGRRAARNHPAFLVGAALTAALLGACTAASTPTPGASASSAASQAAATKAPPTEAPASQAASAPPDTAPPETAPPASAPAGTPPGTVAADPKKKYDCKKLITDAEMRQATGISSVAFFNQELWTDTPGLPEGQTYCQFFAGQGALSIALSVATGPAFTQFEQAAAAAGSAGVEELPGIGDHAVYSAATGFAAARKGGTLLILAVRDMSGSGAGLKGVDVKSAAANILRIAIGRI